MADMTEAQELTAAWLDPQVQREREAGWTWQFTHLAADGPWQAIGRRPDTGAVQYGHAPTLQAAIAAARAQMPDDPHITDYLDSTLDAFRRMGHPGVTFTPEQRARIQALDEGQP